MKKKYYVIGGIMVGLILAVGVTAGGSFAEKITQVVRGTAGVGNAEIGATILSYASDIVGTKTGTTTAGTAFYTKGVTSSKAFLISGDWTAFTIRSTDASTTGSTVSWRILGSFDDKCETATSSTIYDVVTTDQVNWFDLNKADDVTARFNTNGSFTETVDNATGTSVLLHTAGWRCLKFDISASSSKVWAQVRSK